MTSITRSWTRRIPCVPTSCTGYQPQIWLADSIDIKENRLDHGPSLQKASSGAYASYRASRRRTCLVGGVAPVVVLVPGPPQAVVVLVSGLQDARGPSEHVTSDLDLDLGIMEHVEEPSRRAIRATVGGDQHVV